MQNKENTEQRKNLNKKCILHMATIKEMSINHKKELHIITKNLTEAYKNIHEFMELIRGKGISQLKKLNFHTKTIIKTKDD